MSLFKTVCYHKIKKWNCVVTPNARGTYILCLVHWKVIIKIYYKQNKKKCLKILLSSSCSTLNTLIWLPLNVHKALFFLSFLLLIKIEYTLVRNRIWEQAEGFFEKNSISNTHIFTQHITNILTYLINMRIIQQQPAKV